MEYEQKEEEKERLKEEKRLKIAEKLESRSQTRLQNQILMKQHTKEVFRSKDRSEPLYKKLNDKYLET